MTHHDPMMVFQVMRLPRNAWMQSVLILAVSLPFIVHYERHTKYPGRTEGIISEGFAYIGPFFGVLIFGSLAFLFLFKCWRISRRLLGTGSHRPVSFSQVSFLAPLIILSPLTFHWLLGSSFLAQNDAAFVTITRGIGDPTFSFRMYVLAVVFCILLQNFVVLNDAEQSPNEL